MSGASAFLKSSFKSAFNLAGIDVRRKRTPEPYEPPPMYDDPLEALYLAIQHKTSAAFKCPVNSIVDPKGFGFGEESWHPFVAVTQELERNGEAAAEALLERFYAACRPRSAAEAYVGFNDAPAFLREWSPHMYCFSPWRGDAAPEYVLSAVARWVERDNSEHGRPDLTLTDGYPTFGPVTPDKRKLELRRLANLAGLLKQAGFDRTKGGCHFTLIRRGPEMRFFVAAGGYHRTAVSVAQRATWVPAQFSPHRAFVDVADVDYWPQVQRGLWSRSQALAYVDYLFEYNSANWASLSSPRY